MELTINGQFRLGPKIGSGSFGEVHSGTNMQTGESVAIKMESVLAPGSPPRPLISPTQLELECKAYRDLEGGCKRTNIDIIYQI